MIAVPGCLENKFFVLRALLALNILPVDNSKEMKRKSESFPTVVAVRVLS